jgi:hypothetical protein
LKVSSLNEAICKTDNRAIKMLSLRKVENLHIVFWLLKDTCWVLVWRPLGVLMVIPTICFAFYLLFQSRKNRPETYHNIAVCAWIMANSTWMCGEFFNYEMRPVAAFFFISGLVTLAWYYIRWYKIDQQGEQNMSNSGNN